MFWFTSRNFEKIIYLHVPNIYSTFGILKILRPASAVLVTSISDHRGNLEKRRAERWAYLIFFCQYLQYSCPVPQPLMRSSHGYGPTNWGLYSLSSYNWQFFARLPLFPVWYPSLEPAMFKFFIASLRLFFPLLISSSFALSASVDEGQNTVCAQIGASISSSSNVYYPGTNCFTVHHAMKSTIVLIGDPLYARGIQHWANYTSQAAKCVVEPGTASDVGIIVNSFLSGLSNSSLISLKLGIVGKTRTTFAVSDITTLFCVYLKSWRF